MTDKPFEVEPMIMSNGEHINPTLKNTLHVTLRDQRLLPVLRAFAKAEKAKEIYLQDQVDDPNEPHIYIVEFSRDITALIPQLEQQFSKTLR